MDSDSTKETSLYMVKQWILEHACKHRMDKVIRAIFQKGDQTLIKLSSMSEIPVNPAFMFVTLVQSFIELLRGYIEGTNDEIEWDDRLTILISDLLEDLYKENHFVSFKLFINATTRLKTMELMQLMKKKTDSAIVVHHLNQNFPRWDKNAQKRIQKTFNIANIRSLRKAEKAIVICRRFILDLLVNDVRWRNYLQHCYVQDMKNFATVVTKELEEVLNVLRPKLPPSPIEQVLNGAKDDLDNSGDPIIQLLLEHLMENMSQDDFLTMLKILDPETESQVTPGHLAYILDEDSDTASIGSESKTLTDDELPNTKNLTNKNIITDDNLSDATTVEFKNDCDVSYGELDMICEETQSSNLEVTATSSHHADKEMDWDDIISPSEEEQSSDSSTRHILPDFERHLVVGCGRPCLVKLQEYMIVKIDGVKYEIFS